MEIDQIIADIIATELSISSTRVVVYGQNFDAPNDDDLFIVISTKNVKTIGSSNKFDEDTLKEVKTASVSADIQIELTSRNRDAYEQKEFALMALTSTYSIQKQEEEKFKLFRSGDILDMTETDGASSLYRFIVQARAFYLKIKSTSVEYYDKYRETDYLQDSK